MNDKSETAGEVIEILVEDGESVSTDNHSSNRQRLKMIRKVLIANQ